MRLSICWILAALTAGVLPSSHGASAPAKPPSTTPKPPGVLFRAHFLGTTRLAADTNAAPWMKMASLPASQALAKETIQKLARAPFQLFHRRLSSTNDFAAVFEAFLNDMIHAESFVEIRGDSNQVSEAAIAARLPADRAEFWRTNLTLVVENWTDSRAQPTGSGAGAGWDLKLQPESGEIQLARAGAWTVLTYARTSTRLQAEYAQQIKKTGSPDSRDGGAWVSVFADTPSLPALPGEIGLPKDLPCIDLRIAGKNGVLKTQGDLAFRQELPWPQKPWLVPTNLIRDPIISFTAMRGVGAFLHKFATSIGIHVDSAPDQIYMWALNTMPTMTFGAAAGNGMSNLIYQAAPQIAAKFNPAIDKRLLGEITVSSNGIAMVWSGVPMVLPMAAASRSDGNDYVVFGLVPLRATGNTAPSALISQLYSKPNVVYYDWEFTPEREQKWDLYWDSTQVFLRRPRLAKNHIATNWLGAVLSNCGNTVTTMVQTDRHHVVLERSGTLGMTGFELIALVNWLGSPRFPLYGYSLPASPGPGSDPHRKSR